MADTSSDAPRKKSWGRRLGIILGVLLALLVVTYLVVTSSAFFKGVIVPKIGAALNANLQVQDASIRPFSGVTLKGVKLQTTGPDPVVTADEVRVRHSLTDIIGGKMTIHEATLIAPVITVVQNPDGTSNLDPLLQGSKEKNADDGKSKSDEPTQVNARNIAIQNGTLRVIQRGTNGTTHAEITALNLTLDQIANGATSKLSINSGVQVDKSGGTNSGTLQGVLKGDLQFALDSKLAPQSASGQINFDTQRAEGAYKDAAQMAAAINVDVTPTEVRNLALNFNRAGRSLGQLRVNGPFDTAKTEGRLTVQLAGVDRNILEFLTAGKGMDFGSSALNSTNVINITQAGKAVALEGALAGRSLGLQQKNQQLPAIDLDAGYNVNVDLNKQSALVQRFNVTARQQGREFLLTSLSSPMTVSWGGASNTAPDAALSLILTNLNLADWKAVLPTNAPVGRVGARINLTSQRGGQLLRTDASLRVDQLSVALNPTNTIANAAVAFNTTGTVEQMKIVNLESFNFSLDQGNQNLARGSGAARYDLNATNLTAKLDLQAALAGALKIVPVADLAAQTGDLRLNTQITDAGGVRRLTGTITLTNFTGRYTEYDLNQFTANTDLDVAMRGDAVDISRVNIAFARAGASGGNVALNGKVNLATKQAAIAYGITNLNQNTIEPFLKSALGANKLVSITLNTSGKADYDPAGATAIISDLRLENLVVDQGGTNRVGPLMANVQLDAGLAKEILDLRKLNLKLSPTERATNLLEVKGRVGLNKTNAPPGTITIASSSMDVTPFYNLFAGKTNAATAATPPAQTDSAPANVEPSPVDLPFRDLTVDVKFDRFYLRDLAFSNWVTTIKLRTNTVAIEPLKMALNGAPVNGVVRLDLSVPGYRYDVSFDADRAPLDPIATTFLNSTPGQYAGQVLASIKVKGAGTTGANLQKNLQGDVNVLATNLNLQVVNLEQSKKLKRWAELTQTILSRVGVLLQIPDLLQSPLNVVKLDVDMGGGQVKLTEMHVLSQAFTANASGTIPIEAVLTNSPLDVPLQVALRRSIAEKSRIAGVLDTLAPAGTPTNSAYVPLPTFVRVAGTVGAPKADIDEKRLFKGAVVGTIGKALTGEGELGKGLQNLLGGNKGGTNAPASNAAQSTNAPSTRDALFQGLGGLLNRAAGNTNAAPPANPPATAPRTNAPAQTNRVNPLDLLRGLQRPQQPQQ
ncbi:MAG TPA: hypothetical protein VEH27_04825 [Methylomirabilota bacterium]|nr:hypothetical protein [Methylomirabilota bacterium]